MAQYRLYYHTIATASVVVEADDPSEAMDKADDAFGRGPHLCGYCALGLGTHPAIDLNEWEPNDDEPEEVPE